MLFLGTAIYNGDMGACDNGYETLSLAQPGTGADADSTPRGLELLPVKRTPLHMSSPALTRYDLLC